MVSHFPMQYQHQQYRAAPLTVDTHHAQEYFKQEDAGVLDDSILDHSAVDSGLELSPPMADSRRESFAGMPAHSLFSPQPVDMQSVPSNNPFENQPTSFVNLDHAQPGPFMVPGSSWPMAHSNSGSGTPIQHFDNGMHAPMAAHNPFSNHGNMFSAGNPSLPTSPQGNWMTGQGSNKRSRADSPVLRGHNELRRGDGIRKKNARFEIPADRNLHNIDQLIAMSTDDAEIKELKQQKRLLRNRQAALDSRQRKKQHTERLEEEKKDFGAMYQSLAEQNQSLLKDNAQLLREKQAISDFIESTNLDKEEMIRAHTLETAELRKKIGVLTEHIQQLERNARSTGVSQNNAFNDGFGSFEDMNMPGAWDAGHFIHDYPVEPEQDVKPNMALVATKKSEPQTATTDKNAQPGGLLFMLFLVGAFVLSNRTAQPLPAVSDDVRAASASLLDTVLKDAGVAHGSNSIQPLAPQPSSTSSWSDPSTSMPVAGEHAQPSTLVDFSDSLTRPTQEQTNEQIFSLSAAQYNGVNDQNFLQNAPPKSMSQGRRNLADALAAMRMTNKHDGAAEVYTRSLLWDQIPGDVVRNFAKMVAERNGAPNTQQCDASTKT
jgi:hypothetical protein